MVDKKEWYFAGYVATFFSVYLFSLLFSITPTIFQMKSIVWGENAGNAFITTANATFAGTATSASWLPVTGVVIAACVVVSLLFGGFFFKQAMD